MIGLGSDKKNINARGLIPFETEGAIHQDSTYPPDSLVGHTGMLLLDKKALPSKTSKNAIQVSD